MVSYRKYLICFAVFLTLQFLGYYALFCFQLGAPVEAEYWLWDLRFLKQDIAQRTPSPKLVIVSGSNGLFGIDSAELQKYVKMPVANLATHAGLPLDWMLDFAAASVKKGDVLLLPFEWDYYLADYTRPSQWMTRQVVAWDKRYFEDLNPIRKIQFIASMSCTDFFNNLLTRLDTEQILREHPNRRLDSREASLDAYYHSDHSQAYGYNYLNINRYGDIMQNWKPPRIVGLDTGGYYSLDSMLEPIVLKKLKQSIDDLQQRGVKVLVTFPPIAINPVTASKLLKDKTAKLEDVLRHAGIPLLGNQAEYYFPQSFFFDNPHHLTWEGKKKRTEILGKELSAALAR
jgi:hypothetical protein